MKHLITLYIENKVIVKQEVPILPIESFIVEHNDTMTIVKAAAEAMEKTPFAKCASVIRESPEKGRFAKDPMVIPNPHYNPKALVQKYSCEMKKETVEIEIQTDGKQKGGIL